MPASAAISTPNAPGGLAVIRISGSGAIDIAARIFTPAGSRAVTDMPGYTCAYGTVSDENGIIDDCILTVFRAPHSYTGEDTAELSCHGGIYVSRRILRAVLSNGAVPAGPGEFTRQAFLNGKIDLTQAEAVMDIISAKGERELRAAEALREGAAFRKAEKCSGVLMKILGDLAAWADYPEEDIPEVEPSSLINDLRGVRQELFSLVENYDTGRIMREGVAAAIVGRPNVGKSTLFNCLSGCERSIVTDIAGTTRDVIEETVMLGDIALRLADTAGIHDTDDRIEGIGIGYAEKMIDSAELIIAVFDGGSPLTDDDMQLIKRINNKKYIAVVNKSDTPQQLDITELSRHISSIVSLSAKDNDGIDRLQAAVEELFSLNTATVNAVCAANERQKACIDRALLSTEQAIAALENGELLDAVNVLIDEAEQSLLSLTGKKVTDAVVDEVFSRFCVGK